MRLLLGVALLGVAAAVPSSIQLKEAAVLVQRPRQEGHARNWKLEAQQHGQQSALRHSRPSVGRGLPFSHRKQRAHPPRERAPWRSGACTASPTLLPLTIQAQQAKLEAKKAEQEAIEAEKEFQAASEAEAAAKASVDAAAKAAAAADAKAARREENQQMKREEAMEKAAREQKKAEDKAAAEARRAEKRAKIEEAFQEAKAHAVAAKKEAAEEARARAEAEADAKAEARAEALVKAGPVLSRAGALLDGSRPNRTGAALLVSEARAMATSSAEVEIYQAAQLDLKLSETQGRKVLWYQFQIPQAATAEASLIAMRLLCDVPAHVTASLLNRVGRARGVDRKQHRRATSLAAQEPAERCSMECPARRLIDTQYSCAAEGRTDQQPWQNALYRVNTLLLNHKTVDQVRVRVRVRVRVSVACAAGAESMAAARAIARNMCVASTPTPTWFGFGFGFGS